MHGMDCVPLWQATMVVADAKESLTITGNGDVVEPHDGVVGEHLCSGGRTARLTTCIAVHLEHEGIAVCAAIGSGGAYALAAARALIDIPDYDAMAVGASPQLLCWDALARMQCVMSCGHVMLV